MPIIESMISVALARKLRDGGVRWTPESGDRFVIVDRDMDDEVFVLANMTIELHRLPEGDQIGFNGTTEWALDSVDPRESVWLPSETQLRGLLGRAFTALDRTDEGWRVSYTVGERSGAMTHEDACEAYALVLLHLVTG